LGHTLSFLIHIFNVNLSNQDMVAKRKKLEQEAEKKRLEEEAQQMAWKTTMKSAMVT